MSHTDAFLEKMTEAADILALADADKIEKMANELALLREHGGRLFIIGVGGSAANASHAVNDFRKLCGIEAYCPTDNIAELTARTNDDGWENVFSLWLEGCNVTPKDAILVFSVGGGSLAPPISMNIVLAVQHAAKVGMKVFGIVGRDGGATKLYGDYVVVIPTVEPSLVTPITESFQGIILHCLVSHPKLAMQKAKWEGTV